MKRAEQQTRVNQAMARAGRVSINGKWLKNKCKKKIMKRVMTHKMIALQRIDRTGHKVIVDRIKCVVIFAYLLGNLNVRFLQRRGGGRKKNGMYTNVPKTNHSQSVIHVMCMSVNSNT